jgi:hypothetical protein
MLQHNDSNVTFGGKFPALKPNNGAAAAYQNSFFTSLMRSKK